WHELSGKYHPDSSTFPDAEERFKNLSQAHAIITTLAQTASISGQHSISSGLSEPEGYGKGEKRLEEEAEKLEKEERDIKKAIKEALSHVGKKRPEFSDIARHMKDNWFRILLMLLGVGFGFYLSFIYNLLIFGIPILVAGLAIGWQPFLKPVLEGTGVINSGDSGRRGPLGKIFGAFSHLFSKKGSIGDNFLTGDIIPAIIVFALVSAMLFFIMGYLMVEFSVLQFVVLGTINTILLILLWMGSMSEPEVPHEEPVARREEAYQKALPPGEQRPALEAGREEGRGLGRGQAALPAGEETKALPSRERRALAAGESLKALPAGDAEEELEDLRKTVARLESEEREKLEEEREEERRLRDRIKDLEEEVRKKESSGGGEP
ncbi:MAG: hypothetical protein ACP5E4_02260, partial [Candidatus Aenigmatarchaeota archaeon]